MGDGIVVRDVTFAALSEMSRAERNALFATLSPQEVAMLWAKEIEISQALAEAGHRQTSCLPCPQSAAP